MAGFSCVIYWGKTLKNFTKRTDGTLENISSSDWICKCNTEWRNDKNCDYVLSITPVIWSAFYISITHGHCHVDEKVLILAGAFSFETEGQNVGSTFVQHVLSVLSEGILRYVYIEGFELQLVWKCVSELLSQLVWASYRMKMASDEFFLSAATAAYQLNLSHLQLMNKYHVVQYIVNLVFMGFNIPYVISLNFLN